MTITFIGHGYVGLVTASIFADLGNKVWVIGHTKEKIENLKKGILPIYEPGLEEIVKRNVEAGRLLFTLDYDQAIPESSAVFIAVGTPPKENGEADLSVVYEVAKKLANYLGNYTVVCVKSTVPVGTNKKVKEEIEKIKPGVKFDIASVPEFLREGQAIRDTLQPDRVVIGTESEEARKVMQELHQPIDGKIILTNIETAEMIKYAANAFLATKISFANAVAQLSEVVGADGLKVLEAVGQDKRVGGAFLSPGAGYGGSCFPKDVKALIAISKNHGFDFALLREVEEINKKAANKIIEKTEKLLNGSLEGKNIAVLGLSFKPDTDDMRDAPSITIINQFLKKKARVKGYDPIAMENAKRIIKGIVPCKNVGEAVEDADIIVLLTEWNEFKELDVSKIGSLMKEKRMVDARNVYDPEKMKQAGFKYEGVGR